MSFISQVAGTVASNQSDHHDHDHHHDHQSGSTYCTTNSCLRNWKIGFATILLVEGLIFTFFALMIKRCGCMNAKRFRRFLSFVNIAGGGIFVATGFLHALPEALSFFNTDGHETHDHHSDHKEHSTSMHGHDNHWHGFPVGPLVMLITFLSFIFIDIFVFPHSHGNDDGDHDHGDGDHDHGDGDHDHENRVLDEESRGISSHSRVDASNAKRLLPVLVTTLGIAIHSIFESIALGATKRWGSMLNLFIAIAGHRWATAMALGARYAKDKISILSYCILAVGFSAIAPIGIGIGAAVGSSSNTVLGIVFAITTGVFFYVGGFETPVAELVGHVELKFAKFAVYVAGAVCMAIITGILSATGVH